MKPTDEIHFYAECNSLGFIESASRRWEFEPEIPLKKGCEYRVAIFEDGRVVVKEHLDDGWRVVVDRMPDRFKNEPEAA
jgi:hypothetical protein